VHLLLPRPELWQPHGVTTQARCKPPLQQLPVIRLRKTTLWHLCCPDRLHRPVSIRNGSKVRPCGCTKPHVQLEISKTKQAVAPRVNQQKQARLRAVAETETQGLIGSWQERSSHLPGLPTNATVVLVLRTGIAGCPGSSQGRGSLVLVLVPL